MNTAAIVPSLNPDEKFARVIEELAKAGFPRIYVVDDGSAATYAAFFDAAAALPGCVVLRHPANQGKGRALKTAFARFLADDEGLAGVVTLDGDGQHRTEDVVKVARALEAHPGDMVLGYRNFDGDQVPAKSAMGNKITRGVFRAFCGLRITDTQTGLRGLPAGFLPALLQVNGERYEYETNMLLEASRHGVGIVEVPIETVYIDNNATSHFRPLQDSARIYWLIFRFSLLKFITSSLLSTLLDYLVFILLNAALRGAAPGLRLLVATGVARVCSAIFNFTVNKTLVFGSRATTGGALGRYALVCAVQMLCSYGGVYLLSVILPVPTVLAKVLVDTTLFFISYGIQRKWVFQV